MKKYCILKSDLEQIKKLVYNQNQEWCGSLDIINNDSEMYDDLKEFCENKNCEEFYLLRIDKLEEGIDVDLNTHFPRKFCGNSGETRIKFHTHPLSELSYPSFEDITRVMNNDLDVSIIATRYGIYILKPPNYDDVVSHFKNKFSKHKDHFKQYKDWMDKDPLFHLYTLEYNKGFNRSREIFPTEIANSEERYIQDIMNAISRESEITIKFYSWDKIIL